MVNFWLASTNLAIPHKTIRKDAETERPKVGDNLIWLLSSGQAKPAIFDERKGCPPQFLGSNTKNQFSSTVCKTVMIPYCRSTKKNQNKITKFINYAKLKVMQVKYVKYEDVLTLKSSNQYLHYLDFSNKNCSFLKV